ncbi:MAG: hypothetical protein KAS23_04790, partial [Anaerohalosphaera sp.]|nr:hypothetical protein [Anaerohalosphaera sp.]
ITTLLNKNETIVRIKTVKPLHILLALVSAAAISILFFSSFLANPKGIADSVLTYTDYLNRASETPVHTHPWYYYLKTLLYFKLGAAPVFTEAIIVILAAVGFLIALIKPRTIGSEPAFIRFIAFYTFIMTAVYSFISYKTPWCLLGFLSPMIILASFAIVAIFKTFHRVSAKAVFAIIVILASVHLTYQTCQANFKYYESTANPYVYGHSTSDVAKIAERTLTLASHHELGSKMPIEIIAPNHDYWPFPWYLRTHDRDYIGYYSSVETALPPAPIIITFPQFMPDLVKKLYELPPPGQKNMYLEMFSEPTYIRPYVQITAYVRKDLNDIAERQSMPAVPNMPQGN